MFRIILAVVLILTITPALGQDLVDEHTLGFWKFDENDGESAIDSSGNENSGEIEDAEYVDGIAGTALFFDGESSHVVVNDSETLHPETGNITIEAWIKVASDPVNWGPGASAAGGIVFKQDAYQWVVQGNSNGILWFGIWGAALKTTDTYFFSEHVDEWHHAALTFEGDSQQAKIYVDGELNTEGTVGEAVDQSSAPLYIGYKGDDGVYFHGIIDEVRLSDVVRTEEEIQEMIDVSLAVYSVDKLSTLWAKLKSK